jgi:hypothetical protein
VHDFLPLFCRKAGDIKTSAAKLLNMILDRALGLSIPHGQRFTGNLVDPPQNSQLREVKPWFPPLNRVGFSPYERFAYYGTGGTRSSRISMTYTILGN